MRETSVRELLHDAMAGDEPPIRQHLLGSAVRAARRTRRLRFVAAVSATVAVVPALAFGLPALAGTLGQSASGQHGAGIGPSSGHGGNKPSGHPRHMPKKQTVSPRRLQFLRPKLPAAYVDDNPVPITDQSLGQLLIDDMPAGARLSQIEASLNPNPDGAPVTYRTVYAGFNNVTTRIGAGLVQADMMAAGSSAFDFGCQGTSAASCRSYRLPGGVQVAEEYMGGGLYISVFRPKVAEVGVNEANQAAAAGSPATKGMPLTLAQLLKVALDPRWQFSISQSFVQQASGLKVAPYGAGS